VTEDQTKSEQRAKSITLKILEDLLPKDPDSKVGVRLWDGSLWPDEQPRAATIVLNHPGALKAMFHSMNEVGKSSRFTTWASVSSKLQPACKRNSG
jgi:hypothetical protein